MNPNAKKYFETNPDARYWYFSHNIRVANPRLRPWLDNPRDPWPAAHETLNLSG